MTKLQKILMAVLIVIVIVLLARFVVFKKQFDNWGEGLKQVGSWQENYKASNPNATKKDVGDAFDKDMAGLKEWKNKYKSEHPDATEVEIEAAFNAAWD